MPRILCLEHDGHTRVQISNALNTLGYHSVVVSTVHEAEEKGVDFDLYVCDGTMDGLHFALGKKEQGKRVLIISALRKFSRLPYMNVSHVADVKMFRTRLNRMHVGAP